MLIEQIIEFQLRGPGPPGRTFTPTIGFFYDKTKIFKENLRVDNYFPEEESSRTHFEVLGLGLKAYKPRKCPVLGSRTALFFDALRGKITKKN